MGCCCQPQCKCWRRSLVLGPAAPHACPCRQVFPHGLPPAFTLVLTLLLKKNSTGEHWYLFQVTDQQGYPQVWPWGSGIHRWQGDSWEPSPSMVLSPLCPALPGRARPREEPGVSGQGTRSRVCQRCLHREGCGVPLRWAVAQGGGGCAEPRRLCPPRLRLHLLQAAGSPAGAGPRGQHLPGAGCRTWHPSPGESLGGCRHALLAVQDLSLPAPDLPPPSRCSSTSSKLRSTATPSWPGRRGAARSRPGG